MKNNPHALQEIQYLKKITNIANLKIKDIEFFTLNINTKDDSHLKSFFLDEFKPNHEVFMSHSTEKKQWPSNIFDEMVRIFNQKIDNLALFNQTFEEKITYLKEKNYHTPITLSFQSLNRLNSTENQKIQHFKKTIPLYIIPTLIQFSYDVRGISDKLTTAQIKEQLKKNLPNIRFIVANIPFIPQKLLNYESQTESDEKTNSQLYAPLFDIDITEKNQTLIAQLFSEDKTNRFPLLSDTKDNQVGKNDYYNSVEIKEPNNENINLFFKRMDDFLKDQLSKKLFILADYHYSLNNHEILLSSAKNEVDSLYQAYNMINLSINRHCVEINDTLAEQFFNKNKTPLKSDIETESIFFDSTNHYGSFNINLANNQLISLALNQRIALNTTTLPHFEKNEVIAVNGPPGTGKTTVLQSIIANMVTENTLDFIQQSTPNNSFKWANQQGLKTPKQLNIGCSFTKQAVKNVLNSLDFQPPTHNDLPINLVWNKRWLYLSLHQPLKYCLDSSNYNENKNDIQFFIHHSDELIDYFKTQYSQLYTSDYNIEENLKRELLTLKNQLDNFKLHLFNNVFFLQSNKNEPPEYLVKPQFQYNSLFYGEKITHNNRLIANLKEQQIQNADRIVELNQQQIADLKKINEYQQLLTNYHIKNFDQINNPQTLSLLQSLQNLTLLISQKNEDITTHIQQQERNAINIKEQEILLNNIQQSWLSKIKIKILGQDGNIEHIKANLKTYYQHATEYQSNLPIKKEELIQLNHTLNAEETALNKNLTQEINTLSNISNTSKNQINFIENNKKTIATQLQELVTQNNSLNQDFNQTKEIEQLYDISAEQLNQNHFKEFHYATDSIQKLISNIQTNNIDLLTLYTEINLILDNTLRYKCFQLSMRLKEWYFLQLSKDFSQLKDNDYHIAYHHKNKSFKNVGELYELNYLSLIYPLIISTIHSLGSKIRISQQDEISKSYYIYTEPAHIDNIIVDESGQISVDIGYIAAWNAKRMICVGDTDQIKPVYPIEKSLDYLISKYHKRSQTTLTQEEYCTYLDNLGQINCCESSLMNIAQKLTKYHPYNNVNLSRGLYLTEHRRCPDEIIDYCNKIIYKGVLIPKKGTFQKILSQEKPYIQNTFKQPWVFITVDGKEKNKENNEEAHAIYQYLLNFIFNSQGEYTWDNIGKDLAILTPFRNQANTILGYIKEQSKHSFYKGSNRLKINRQEESDNDLIIGTVHALQGAEKKIILFSFVSRALNPNSMIIQDPSILNVAISRSKLNLTFFGHKNLLTQESPEMEYIIEACSK